MRPLEYLKKLEDQANKRLKPSEQLMKLLEEKENQKQVDGRWTIVGKVRTFNHHSKEVRLRFLKEKLRSGTWEWQYQHCLLDKYGDLPDHPYLRGRRDFGKVKEEDSPYEKYTHEWWHWLAGYHKSRSEQGVPLDEVCGPIGDSEEIGSAGSLSGADERSSGAGPLSSGQMDTQERVRPESIVQSEI